MSEVSFALGLRGRFVLQKVSNFYIFHHASQIASYLKQIPNKIQ
jgi:hypothetical protein